MRKIAIVLTASAALLTGPALNAREKVTGEERLARVLDGREAGKPVSCIPLHVSRDTQVIDKTAIVYGSGNTLYVNRPHNPKALDDDDVMVIKIHGSQLCRMDIVHVHERSGYFYSGSIGLEDFVPYRRAARN